MINIGSGLRKTTKQGIPGSLPRFLPTLPPFAPTVMGYVRRQTFLLITKVFLGRVPCLFKRNSELADTRLRTWNLKIDFLVLNHGSAILTAVKLWTSYLTSLGLSFFMYKMWGEIIVPTLEGSCEDFMN